MKYSDIPVLKDTTYYTIVVFKDKNKSGETIPNEYKRFSNAARKFNELKNSGLYECVMIRKEEVTTRRPGLEISSSSPFTKWEVA